MGEYLSSPNTDKITDKGSNSFLSYGVCSMQGWRKTMENTFIAKASGQGKEGNFDVFGIFTGNGGAEVAQYAQKHFCEELFANDKFNSYQIKNALTETFLKMDSLMLKTEGQNELRKFRENNKKIEDKNENKLDDEKYEYTIVMKKMLGKDEKEEDLEGAYSGCSACVGVFDKKNRKIYFAGVGNTEVSICNSTEEKTDYDSFFTEHKPSDKLEHNRIMDAGGWFVDEYLKGNLNSTRGLGFFDYKLDKNKKELAKPFVSSKPELKEYVIPKGKTFILFISEGILDCIKRDDLSRIIKQRLDENIKNDKLEEILSNIFDDLNAEDLYNNLGKVYNNMTSILIIIN